MAQANLLFVDVLHNIVRLTAMGETVEDVFSSNSRTRWDSRSTQRIELDVTTEAGKYEYILVLSHDLKRERVTLTNEIVKYEGRTVFLYEDDTVKLHNNEGVPKTQFAFRGTRSFLSQVEARPENTILTKFLESLHKLWLVRLDPLGIKAESKVESDTLDADGANFASWYRHLSQERPEDLPDLFGRLSEALAGFRNLRTVSIGRGGQKRELLAVFEFEKSKYEIDFDDLSDGERATIVLYALLMDSNMKQRTLLLDEPENYVGLALVQPWLVELVDAIRIEGQLFLISHHPEVIDYLSADHSLLFERPDGGPSIVRLEPFSRDKGLRASDLVARGLLDG